MMLRLQLKPTKNLYKMENKLLDIIKDMKALLLKASGSLEGEDQRTADEIDGYLQNLDYYIEKSKEDLTPKP